MLPVETKECSDLESLPKLNKLSAPGGPGGEMIKKVVQIAQSLESVPDGTLLDTQATENGRLTLSDIALHEVAKGRITVCCGCSCVFGYSATTFTFQSLSYRL